MILFVRRLMAVLAGGVLLFLLAPPSAMAAIDASLSDVKSTAAGVTGVLTFRSANAVQVDPATLVASVDGTPSKVAIAKATHIERSAMLVIDTSGSMGASGMEPSLPQRLRPFSHARLPQRSTRGRPDRGSDLREHGWR